MDSIVKFHYDYEKIHPFQDGNGRTGRMIIFKQCIDSNIIPIIIKDDTKAKYYHSWHVAQVDGNIKLLRTYFEEQQKEYYEMIRDYV